MGRSQLAYFHRGKAFYEKVSNRGIISYELACIIFTSTQTSCEKILRNI